MAKPIMIEPRMTILGLSFFGPFTSWRQLTKDAARYAVLGFVRPDRFIILEASTTANLQLLASNHEKLRLWHTFRPGCRVIVYTALVKEPVPDLNYWPPRFADLQEMDATNQIQRRNHIEFLEILTAIPHHDPASR